MRYRGRLLLGPALAMLCVAGAWAQMRIVSLSPTPTEIVYALGAGSQVVGVTSFCIFPAQVLADVREGRARVVSDFTRTNMELIDSLKPDLILTDTDFQRALADGLRKRGYRVLHFVPKSLEEVFRSIEETGDAIGRGALAREITAGYRREVAEIAKKSSALPRVRVYMEINHMGPWAVGRVSPLQDIIAAAGGENVFADSARGVFMTTNEEVVRRNPDVILSPIWLHAKLGGYDGITPLAEIYGREGYDRTRAVQRSRVLYYDSALLKHEGPRQVLAIRKLAHLLHPDAFDDPPGTIPWELGWVRD